MVSIWSVARRSTPSSVKQTATRLKEGGRDLLGAQRAQTKEYIAGQGNIEKRVREVPETSIKQVQHWFLTETGETVWSGDHLVLDRDR